MSFLLLNSSLVLADTTVCSNEKENIVTTLNEGILTVNSEKLECMEVSETDCTVINFETTEATKLTIAEDKKSAVLEIMPAPGSGEIKSIDLLCK